MVKPNRFDAPIMFKLPPEETLDSANARCDRLQTEIDSYKAEAAELRATQDAVRIDAVEIDRLASERLEIIDRARIVLGKNYFPTTGRTSAREIQLAALAKVDSQRFDAKSDEYIAARFDAAIEAARVSDASFAQMAKTVFEPATIKGELDTALDAAAAEAKTLAVGGAPSGAKTLN